MAINRDYNPLFLGARIWMVRTGTAYNDDVVGIEDLPAAPTAEVPGPWVFMGRARSFQTQSEYQTAEVKGVGRGLWYGPGVQGGERGDRGGEGGVGDDFFCPHLCLRVLGVAGKTL